MNYNTVGGGKMTTRIGFQCRNCHHQWEEDFAEGKVVKDSGFIPCGPSLLDETRAHHWELGEAAGRKKKREKVKTYIECPNCKTWNSKITSRAPIKG